MKGRKKYPTEEVAPEDFLDNNEINRMLKERNDFKFTQEDGAKLLNCVHCNECGTSEERIQLNQKFLQDGNEISGLKEMIKNFEDYQTPYPTDKMRIKKPPGIRKNSKTLFFMGCLSTMRIKKFTENALKYLVKNNIDFTTLDKEICCGYPLYVSGAKEEYAKYKTMNTELFSINGYEKIICLCPACYYIFRTDYKDLNIDITYISDYLKPSSEKKSGTVSIQHLCQLKNREHPEVAEQVDNILEQSGYDVIDVPHYCCGAGIGRMHRVDVIDKLGSMRVKDFKGDYYTTYCPSCYWSLRTYGKKVKIEPKLRDIFDLLI